MLMPYLCNKSDKTLLLYDGREGGGGGEYKALNAEMMLISNTALSSRHQMLTKRNMNKTKKSDKHHLYIQNSFGTTLQVIQLCRH